MTIEQLAHGNALSVADAVAALDDESRPLAGGTDLVALMKDGLSAPKRLVNLKTIVGGAEVKSTADGWHLGSLVTLSTLVDHTGLTCEAGLACLPSAASQSASPQLRHMATLGGNLLQRPRCWYFRNPKVDCWRKGGQRCFAIVGENKYHTILGRSPCVAVHPSDPAVALLALDASVVIAGPRGERTVELAELYDAPARGRQMPDGYRPVAQLAVDEMITEVLIPWPPAGAQSVYVKKAERGAWDFALISVAIVLATSADGAIAHARVALGGVANVPWRATASEAALVGRMPTPGTIREAADAAVAGARALRDNGYKIDLAKAAVREALRALVV